ncbi:phenylacetate--CoA ligase family protein [Thermodesulfobacteriota bacterium]
MSRLDRNSGILSREEKFDPLEWRVYQNKFLQEVVAHAYQAGTPLKVAMLQRGLKPKHIQTVEDLAKLPVTKKSDLTKAQKDNPPFGGFCTVPPSELLRIHRSPGPIFDPVGKEPDYGRWKTSLYAAGFRPGDLVINTFAYHLTPAGHMFEDGFHGVGVGVIPSGVGNTETQVEILKELGVTGYCGTPSFLLAILEKATEMGIDPKKEIKLEIGFVLGEMLPNSMRKRFIDEYEILARQAYGTADVGNIAYECPKTSGMHMHYDVIVEIADPKTGRGLPPGEVGEVVVTCNNKTYPLVRFGTGDLSSIVVDGECACGRTAPRLSGIKGRADQVTKVKGMFVHPSQVESVIKVHPEILKGRLVVDRPKDQDVMTLEVEVEGKAPEGFASAVEKTLKEQAKLKGAVKVVKPGALPEGMKTIEDVRKWD